MVGVPSELTRGGGQGVRRAAPRRERRRRRRCASYAAERLTRVQGAALLSRSSTSCRTRRPAGSPSTSCPPSGPGERVRRGGASAHDRAEHARLAADAHRHSTADASRSRARPRGRADGPASRSPSSRSCSCAPARPTAGRGAAVRRGARLARRPRPHADACSPPASPTRARPSRCRARSPRGCSARGSRVPRADRATPRGSSPTPLAGHDGGRCPTTTQGWASGARAAVRARRTPGAGARARPPGPQGRRPAHAAVCAIAAEAGLLGPHLRLLEAVGRAHQRGPGRACRSTAPGRRRRAGRPRLPGARSCAASRCSPAPRARRPPRRGDAQPDRLAVYREIDRRPPTGRPAPTWPREPACQIRKNRFR